MSSFFDEDLTIFTEGEFSDVATVVDSGSQLTEISGIFDLEASPMFDPTSQTSEGRRIKFMVQTAVVENLQHRDRISIKNKTYEIVGIEPRNDGKLTDLILKQAFD